MLSLAVEEVQFVKSFKKGIPVTMVSLIIGHKIMVLALSLLNLCTI